MWEVAMAEAQGVPIEVVEAITDTCGAGEGSVLHSLPTSVHKFWQDMHAGDERLHHPDDAKRELEDAVKEVFKWADNQKALQIATMHTNAFLTMQRRLRLMRRGSPTALMTPMVLRLGHETLFFDERCAQYVRLSSDITERMDSDPNAVFLGWRDNGDEAWLDRSRTAPRGACPPPKRRQSSRGAGLSFDSSAGFAFYGADTGDGRHFPHNFSDMRDVHDIPHYSRSGHQVPGVATDIHGVGLPRKRGRVPGTQAAFRRTRQRGVMSMSGVMSMDEALAAVSAGTLELFSTAASRAPLLDYNEAIRQQDLGRSVVYNSEARNSLGRSDRCQKRGGRASNLVSTADLYDDTKPYEEIAASCAKIALGKGQGTRDTQERPTLEAEPRGQLPMRADVCAQLVLATMAAGRRCDNLSCNAALQIEPVLNLGYVAPSRSFCSRACMAASCDAQELCAHTPGEMPKFGPIHIRPTAPCPKCGETNKIVYTPMGRTDKALCTHPSAEVQMRDLIPHEGVCVKCEHKQQPAILDFASKSLWPLGCDFKQDELVWSISRQLVFIEVTLLKRWFDARFDGHQSLATLMRSATNRATQLDPNIVLETSSNIGNVNQALAEWGIGRMTIDNYIQGAKANCPICNDGVRLLACDGSSALTNVGDAAHSAEGSAATLLVPHGALLLPAATVRAGIAADDKVRVEKQPGCSHCVGHKFNADRPKSKQPDHASVPKQGEPTEVCLKLFLCLCSHRIVPKNGALLSEVHECHALFRIVLRHVLGDESFRFFEQYEQDGDVEQLMKLLGLAYDVMCKVEVNLFEIWRELFGNDPKVGDLGTFTKLFIGGFHEHMHNLKCRLQHSQYAFKNTGLGFGDLCESYFHVLRQWHNVLYSMGAMFRPSVEVLLHTLNRRTQKELPSLLQKYIKTADETRAASMCVLAELQQLFVEFAVRDDDSTETKALRTKLFHTEVDKWSTSLAAEDTDAEVKKSLAWAPDDDLAEAIARQAAYSRYTKSKKLDDLHLALRIDSNDGVKIPTGAKLQPKLAALEREIALTLEAAKAAMRVGVRQFLLTADESSQATASDLIHDHWLPVATQNLPCKQCTRLESAIQNQLALYELAQHKIVKRDANSKQVSTQCSVFKAKTKARIEGLFAVYTSWRNMVSEAERTRFSMSNLADLLKGNLAQSATQITVAALAPFGVKYRAVRARRKALRSKEERGIRIEEVCILRTEVLDRIARAKPTTPCPLATSAATDVRVLWGWQRALITDGKRWTQILDDWKCRFDANFERQPIPEVVAAKAAIAKKAAATVARCAAASALEPGRPVLNRRDANRDDSEDTR
jgi:hypothetical protein